MGKEIFINTRKMIIKFTFSHNFKKSKEGYIHLPILVLSFDSTAFGVHILGLYFGACYDYNK